MTKNNKNSHKEFESWFNNMVEYVKGGRIGSIIGVLIFSFGLFLFVSYVSYFFVSSKDQSLILNKTMWEIIKERHIIHNFGGPVGAYFSDLLVNRFVGISSIAIIFLLMFLGYCITVYKKFKINYVFETIFIIVWGCIFFAFIFDTRIENTIKFGGNVGMYLSSLLTIALGTIGLILLLVVSLLVFFMIKSARVFKYISKREHHDNRDNATTNKEQEEEYGETSNNKKSISERLAKAFGWINIFKVDDDNDKENEEESDGNDDEKNVSTASHNTRVNQSEGIISQQPKQGVLTDAEDFEIVVPKEDELSDDELTENQFHNQTTAKYNSTTNNENEGVEQQLKDFDPREDLPDFTLPKSSLLKSYEENNKEHDFVEQKANRERIIEVLGDYGIEITKTFITVGPTITLYEIVPKAGTRVSKIKGLEDDIALGLAAHGIRIIAPMPGKGTIGIEVPNQTPQIVSMQSVINSRKFQEFKGELPIVVGKTITDESFVFDLTKLPHLLVAGATGQGKSVGLNAIITSLLYKKHPSELKMVLIDPKMVEFSLYSDIEKHYLAKLEGEDKAIITDVSKATQTLLSLTKEMDDRFELLMNAGVRDIIEYNNLFKKKKLSTGLGHKFMPYIVTIIDEFADLIMTAGKEVETPIARLAQKGRAAGMHLIIATQRPTTNIITGTIKANFPARMAFKVTSQIDSRTILDTTGADRLIGRGDMLFSRGSDLTRIQCAFIDTPEVQDVISFIGGQKGFSAPQKLTKYVPEGSDTFKGEDMGEKDSLFDEAARLIVTHQSGSTSLIQRKFSIGFNRAGRLMDQLQAAGIVGPAQGSKPREVLIMDEYSLEQMLKNK